MNEQKDISLGIAILVLIIALLVGILVLPQREPNRSGPWSCLEKKIVWAEAKIWDR